MSDLTPVSRPVGVAASGVKGMLVMAIAMALFMTNDTFVKLALKDLPLGEALTIRTIAAALILLAIAAWSGEMRALIHVFDRRVLSRSSLDMVTTLAYVAALGVMPIASITTIYMAAPLITIALAVPLLGEKVSWRGWCAIIIGFAGAVIVTRPDPDTFSIMALLPLFAAFSGSIRDLVTRGISREVPGSVVAFAGSIVVTLASLLFGLTETWRMPSLADVAILVGAAAAFSSGTLCLVYAFRNAPIAAVSPLRYLLVVGALISGYFVFGDLPDAWTSVGMLLVVGAGLYSLQAETRRSRAERRAASASSGACVMGGATAACAPRKD